MSQDIKELRVNFREDSKRIIFLAKILLGTHDTINIVSGTVSASNAARAAETLVRLKYVTYTNIKTETVIVDEYRKIRFVITLTKTPDFLKLLEENEANRKKKQEEREAQATAKN